MGPKDKPGTERHRDEQRADRGPVYHGSSDWDVAEEEAGREALDEPAELEATSEVERADQELADPGARGAALGRGGVGIVERDDASGGRVKWRGSAGKTDGGDHGRNVNRGRRRAAGKQ